MTERIAPSQPVVTAAGPTTQSPPTVVTTRTKSDSTYDATAHAALLLRTLTESLGHAGRTGSVTRDFTPLMPPALARIEELIAISHACDWHALETAFGDGLIATNLFLRQVRSLQLDQLYAPIEDAWRQLLDRLPEASRHAVLDRRAKVMNDHDGASFQPPVMDDKERMTLTRQSMLSARQQVRALKDLVNSDRSDSLAVTLCAPVAKHLSLAGDTAPTIQSRALRGTLAPDVEALSSDMQDAAVTLGMKPAFHWDPVFASMFDAENDLRALFALPRVQRPFSGTIDPAKALERLVEISSKGADTVPGEDLPNPDAAIGAIGARFEQIYGFQQAAIHRFESNIVVPPPVRNPGILEQLLDFAISAALSAAFGAIASVASKKLGAFVEKKFTAGNYEKLTGGINSWFSGDKEREAFIKEYAKLSGWQDITKTVIAEGAKDGMKDAMKNLKGLKLPHKPTDPSPLAGFISGQSEAITSLQTNTKVTIEALRGALAQANLESLRLIYSSLSSEACEEARDAHYDAMMREWQNFKALLSSGPSQIETKKDLRDADMSSLTSGVFRATTKLGSDPAAPEASLESLALVNGEYAARKYFHDQPRALADTQMGLNYRLFFDGFTTSTPFDVFVGPDRGIHAENLDERAITAFRIYASGSRVTGETIARAEQTPPKASTLDAFDILKRIVRALSKNITTASLEI